MPKSRELVPFSNPKPLVPGRPGGRSGSGYWKQERQIVALKADMNELGKVLARLSGELIEQVIWLQDPRPKGPEETRRHISMCMGALKREKSLLNWLLGAGFDLYPILAQLFLKKTQEHVEGSQKNEAEPLLVPPEEALVIDQPAAASCKFVCSLTEREHELL